MSIALWIASGLLAALYIFAGANKTFQSRAKLEGMMSWVNHSPTWFVRVVGVLEVLGGIGLILPWLTGIAPILTPIAAAALVLVQIVAIIIHIRLNEAKSLPMNIVLLLLAAFVAIFRFIG
jgi:uncharacterized membrane protein YphA (DoxX/SURF4 family)